MLEVIILINDPMFKQDDFELMLTLVSIEKQEKYRRSLFIQDAQNSVLSDVLARVEICRITRLNNKQLEFSTNPYGKPVLLNSPDIYYNISHSKNYIACALSDEPVGIDIEVIRPVNLDIAEHFFTPEETAYIMSDNQIYRFFEVWTKKESRVKRDGMGMQKSFSSFSVIESAEHEAVYYNMAFNDDKAVCHVCSGKNCEPTVRIINTDMLMQDIYQM